MIKMVAIPKIGTWEQHLYTSIIYHYMQSECRDYPYANLKLTTSVKGTIYVAL